jgi:FAD/FMN-containing dehydrogenase
VTQPDHVEGVAAVVAWCHAQRRPIVAQGGNTGLSGGATPDNSGRAVVLSLSRLRQVRDVDTVNDTITVEAGCTLHEVQQAALAASRLFPLSLALPLPQKKPLDFFLCPTYRGEWNHRMTSSGHSSRTAR